MRSRVNSESMSTHTPPYAHSTNNLTMSPSIHAFLSFNLNSLLPSNDVPFESLSSSTNFSALKSMTLLILKPVQL